MATVATYLLVAVILLALAAAAPAVKDIGSVNIAEVVCPYKVSESVDESRVPRAIKIIKCQDDYREDCEELQDLAMVFNRVSGIWYVDPVSVACVHRRSSGAVAAQHGTGA